MTLLALDLQLPDLGKNPGGAALRHALAERAPSYLAFLLSFYLVANYWLRHHALMRSVVRSSRQLLENTLFLLLSVAALPFPRQRRGQPARERRTAAATPDRPPRRPGSCPEDASDARSDWESWDNIAIFALCLPAAFVPSHYGYLILLLVATPGRVHLRGFRDRAAARSRR